MSNFETLDQVDGGLPGTGPRIYSASTVDNLGAITTAGYLNDINKKIKQNDLFYVNYSDTSTFPLNTGALSTLAVFYVNYSSPNWSLVALPVSGSGQAAAKAVTDNTKPSVASVDGASASYTVGNLLVAGDTNGTIGADSGFGVNNLLRYASVAISAAQFNGMAAAPVLLVAAPGANNLIVVDQMELVMTYGTVPFVGGGVVAAQYEATATGAGVKATNLEAAADFLATASTSFLFAGASGTTTGAIPFATSVNQGLYLSNQTGAFTTGDSTFVAKIHYRIIAVA